MSLYVCYVLKESIIALLKTTHNTTVAVILVSVRYTDLDAESILTFD